jgi:hypothetical protein
LFNNDESVVTIDFYAFTPVSALKKAHRIVRKATPLAYEKGWWGIEVSNWEWSKNEEK